MKIDRHSPANPERLDILHAPFDRTRGGLGAFVVFLAGMLCVVDSAVAATVNAKFHHSSEIPFTAAAYNAAGKSLKLSLGFAPDFGTDLMVIENTGIGAIRGTFANLSQGQEISLPYKGIPYKFVANYFGGSGNDLVLLWPHHSVFSWGENMNGQLGDKSFRNRMAPVMVDASGGLSGKTILAVDGGGNHSIAACSDGSVWAWGLNTSGELGDGGGTTRAAPVRVKQSGALAGKKVIAVSAGYTHSVALCSDGTLAAWGSNEAGQLGDGGGGASPVPVKVDATGVLAGKKVVAISAGSFHNLALCSNGDIVAWGRNIEGELGNANRSNRNTPVLVQARGALAGKSVVGVSAGTDFSVALCSDGTAAVWGRFGGNGDLPISINSAGVLKGRKIVSFRTGNHHCVALCSDGTVVAWGNNSRGQLGNNSTLESGDPVRVSTTGVLVGKKVVAVEAGGDRSSALCSDGTAVSWGDIDSRLLEGYALVPVVVNEPGALMGRKGRLISMGDFHGLAVAVNPSSSLLQKLTIRGGSLSPLFSPKVTTYFMRVDDKAAGISLGPTVKEAALVTVKGRKVPSGTYSGEISLTSGMNRIKVRVAAKGGSVTEYVIMAQKGGLVDVPVVSADDVPYLGSATDFSAFSMKVTLGFHPAVGTNLILSENTGSGFITGYFKNLEQGRKVNLSYGGKIYHFVANYYGGSGNDLVLEWARRKVFAWGSGNAGQLGNNGGDDSPVAVAVSDAGVLSGKTVVQVAGGEGFSLARCVDGTLAAWGAGACLGDGTVADSPVPVEVVRTGALAGKRVVSISAASGTCLAVCSDGTVASWGYGDSGQLGNGGMGFSRVPVAVHAAGALAGKFVVAAAVGGLHCLALCSDGTMVTWGDNKQRQLGNDALTDSAVPLAIPSTGALDGRKVVAITAGLQHSLALCSDGTWIKWGDGAASPFLSPFGSSQPIGENVTALSQGAGRFAVFLDSDGKMMSLGDNSVGQLGNGSTFESSGTPVAVSTAGILSGRRVVSVSSGYSHSVAVCSDGTVATWGSNQFGELGNNSTDGSKVPIGINTDALGGGKALFGAGAYHSLLVVAEPDGEFIGTMRPSSSISGEADSSDPDGDGIPNLMEYVLHGDPNSPSPDILPRMTMDGDKFAFHFNRLASSADDTTQVFQHSADMTNWTDVKITAPTDAGVLLGNTAGDGSQSVTVTVPKGQTGKMFGRLRVLRP